MGVMIIVMSIRIIVMGDWRRMRMKRRMRVTVRRRRRRRKENKEKPWLIMGVVM
jgi:uncharacterized membrane protein YidH (DUF202 family)